MKEFLDKRIGIIVTGGVAAYKVCELVRIIRAGGGDVRIAMTEEATRFVGPVTYEALCGHPVILDTFSPGIPHIAFTRGGVDLLLVAPATANMIAKAANGIADEIASSIIIARACPMAMAPSMNVNMWNSPATQRNVARLRADGVTFIGPTCGKLACNETGAGRMLEPVEISAYVRRLLSRQLLSGKKVVVTAGSTYEPIDPVRGLTNLSSGRQGYAVAQAAFEAGARVVLVTGPASLPPPSGVKTVRVLRAREMLAAVNAEISDADAFIGVAAVCDWTPSAVSSCKLKKKDGEPVLSLTENPDILAEVARVNPGIVCIGFAAETDNLIEAASEKLVEKGAAMIVANDVSRALGSDRNTVTLVTAGGSEKLPEMEKPAVAQEIVRRLAAFMEGR